MTYDVDPRDRLPDALLGVTGALRCGWSAVSRGVRPQPAEGSLT